MAKCDSCGTLFWGGVKHDGRRFCSEKCRNTAVIETVGDMIPRETLDKTIQQVHSGKCPRCGRSGPVDIHSSHQVVSLLVVTRWVSKQRLSCRRCSTKAQFGDLAISLLAGWWGFPWGLAITPVQVTRNLMGLLGGPSRTVPSKQLRRLIELGLAEQIAAANPSVCSQCGYNLRGNVSGVCPECGLRFAPPPTVDLFAQRAAQDTRG